MSRLRIADHPPDDPERSFELRAHFRFRFFCSLHFVDHTLLTLAAVGRILRLWNTSPDDLGLALQGQVAPDLGFLHIQQVGQIHCIMDIGRGRGDRVNDSRLAVHTDVPLHAQKPLVARKNLVHVGVATAIPVFRQARHSDSGSIDDGPFADLGPLLIEIFQQVLEQGLAEYGLLGRIAETAESPLIRGQLPAPS